MFDRPKSGERAILVQLNLKGRADQPDPEEFEQLALAAGAEPLLRIETTRKAPDARYLVGTGKAEEIRQAVVDLKADLVLVDFALSPAQERNLEKLVECRVLDRAGLILDIFAQRAESFAGKLQVELAQLSHLSTRLVRGWTHLERQKGGIGLRGPGETQLETDRRLLAARIKQINKRLAKVHSQRHQGRRARSRNSVSLVSLAGYTNTGKSSLFNRLTGADVLVADQLFATLDTTLRRMELPGSGPIVLSDTVGFVRHLPHDLVEAFRATLEEMREADLILHVVDASDEAHRDRIDQVNEVLSSIDARGVPQIEVYNKIDLLEYSEPRLERTELGHVHRVWLSTHTGAGIELLEQALVEHFSRGRTRDWLRVPAHAGRLRARLFEQDAVVREELVDTGDWMILVDIPSDRLQNLYAEAGLDLEDETAAARAVGH